MKNISQYLKRLLCIFPFLKGYYKLYSAKTNRLQLSLNSIVPIYDNWNSTSYDRHYIYHTAWAARAVRSINPDIHVDISSSLYFCSILSAFFPIKFYDYRYTDIELPDLQSGSADLFCLPFQDNSVGSISCMHVIEHIGLGRYGDPIDWDGDLKAISELKRITQKGGHLLIVIPVGKESKIIFNAHRIYNPTDIKLLFQDDFTLKQFCLIPEHFGKGGLIENPDDSLISLEEYACGCFWYIKN